MGYKLKIRKLSEFEKLIAELREQGFEVEENTHLGARCGFRVELPNGHSVSVQYGYGTYSTYAYNWSFRDYNKTFRSFDLEAMIAGPPGGWITQAVDAEVAVFDKEENLMEIFNGDTVEGYQSPDAVRRLIADVENF